MAAPIKFKFFRIGFVIVKAQKTSCGEIFAFVYFESISDGSFSTIVAHNAYKTG